jgi:hypothetical protein
MTAYIFQNREDYQRGLTFMTRNVRTTILKNKDLEEIRREAYARLSRDIPYCVEALKGGEIKLDSSARNVTGRLGMIAYSIMVLKYPTFPDVQYLENFSRHFDSFITDEVVDIWVYYDGYGDFRCLGELMERFGEGPMPLFAYDMEGAEAFEQQIRGDPYYMLRAPQKFSIKMKLTAEDVNEIYSEMVNCILDAYVYIWKCSGMDLSHPSYLAPPGTIIERQAATTGG